MTDPICIDNAYSTTRKLFSVTGENTSCLPSPSEGGLRTRGYGKDSHAKKPLITIITVVFNGEAHLEETIQSVLGQTYDNVEYLIIDGASTDNTISILQKYSDVVDYWVSEPDNGIYDAMNKAITLAKGTWLNFMNAGDIFNNTDVLQTIFTSSINYEEIDFIYSDTIFDKRSLHTCDIDRNVINHQSLIYRKTIHNEVGLYLVAKGLLISDYLFFMVCKNRRWYKCSTIIANYDTSGMSGNRYFINHFKQKVSVDLMFNNISRIKASRALITYPIYKKIKNLLKRLHLV